MNYIKIKYWSLFLMVLLVACKEDHEINPATYSLLLTGEESKSWQQVSYTFLFDDEEVDDFDLNQFYGIPNCVQGEIYKYIREGKLLEVYQGNDKCDPEGDDLLFRTRWNIVNANASLFLGGADPFILSALTEDSLVYGFLDTLRAPIGDNTSWEFPGIAQWVYKPVE